MGGLLCVHAPLSSVLLHVDNACMTSARFGVGQSLGEAVENLRAQALPRKQWI